MGFSGCPSEGTSTFDGCLTPSTDSVDTVKASNDDCGFCCDFCTTLDQLEGLASVYRRLSQSERITISELITRKVSKLNAYYRSGIVSHTLDNLERLTDLRDSILGDTGLFGLTFPIDQVIDTCLMHLYACEVNGPGNQTEVMTSEFSRVNVSAPDMPPAHENIDGEIVEAMPRQTYYPMRSVVLESRNGQRIEYPQNSTLAIAPKEFHYILYFQEKDQIKATKFQKKDFREVTIRHMLGEVLMVSESGDVGRFKFASLKDARAMVGDIMGWMHEG